MVFLFISDPHEDYAYVYIPTAHWSGNTALLIDMITSISVL